MKRYSLLALLLASSLLATGCVNSITESTTDTSNSNADAAVYEDDYYDEIELVDEDVYGKDLTVVERYPDSVRSYYSSNEYETDVTYQTSDDQEAVREFYLDALESDGWEISEDATDYMELLRGEEDNPEIFTLYLTEYQDQGVLEYELVYEPSLTDEQLEELEAEEDEFDLEF